MTGKVQWFLCLCAYVGKIISYCLDDPLDLLVDYFKTFGHKPCCFDDTHVFITKLLTTADADKVGMANIIVGPYYPKPLNS